jgi:hypothetical protein
MKKIILMTLFLILVVTLSAGFISSKFAGRMSMRINAKDLPEYGLVIVKPSDPDFDGIAAQYLKGISSDEIERLKPFSVFIKNNENKILVSYAVIWEGTEASGKKTVYKKYISNPLALTDKEDFFEALPRTNLNDIIRPGEALLVSLLPVYPNNNSGGAGYGVQLNGSQFDQNSQGIASQFLEKYTDLTISIDGAFFEDGSFVGSNTTHFFEKMNAQVEAKREVTAYIAENLKLGKSRDEIFKVIEDKANDPNVRFNDGSPADYHKYFTKVFADRFNKMRKGLGEEKTLADVQRSHERLKIDLQKK